MFDANPHARFSLTINNFKHDLQVLRFTGKELISQPYAIDVELVSERPDLDQESLLNRQAFLAFNDAGNGIPGQIHRIFQQLTVPQIIAQVLKDHGIFSSSEIEIGGTPVPGAATSLSMPWSVDGLSAPPELPPVIAPSQGALMAASKLLGADFCPICEACREGICLTEGTVAWSTHSPANG
ncbi:hypothetical protein ACYZT3_06735 [Pseudomonas sp. MDT1-16]